MVQIQNKDKFDYGMFNMTKQRSYIAADFYSVLDSEKMAELKASIASYSLLHRDKN